jgi:K+-sensing histidine kinase KdpD
LKKQTTLFFYALSAYVVVQFMWWGYHLIELTQALDVNEKIMEKRIAMVVGEGFVFIVLLLIGLWKIRSSVRKEFELSNRQNNFLLSVTHELKTPIAANKLYLQTIQKRKPDENQREELIAKALKENERLEKLIDNILHAARVENRAMQPIKEDVEVTSFLHNLIQQAKKRYPDSRIELVSSEKIITRFDVFMIETVLSNLIDNAVKYSPGSPQITISVQHENSELLVSVLDEGIGISNEEQKRIFSKFYRVGNEEIRTQKGSGLGLYISQEFVKLHNGSIGCKPNKEKGTNFYFKLPI